VAAGVSLNIICSSLISSDARRAAAPKPAAKPTSLHVARKVAVSLGTCNIIGLAALKASLEERRSIGGQNSNLSTTLMHVPRI